MRITRQSEGIGGLSPEAVVVLASDFSVPLYHAARKDKIRHPLGAYNISIQNVFGNFEAVLYEMAQLVTQVSRTLPLIDINQLLGSWNLTSAQDSLLRSLDEHFDICEKILKAFFSPNSQFNGNLHVEDFRSSVRVYQDHVRQIVNHLKHAQGKVRGTLVLLEMPNGTLIMPTYSIEGVDASGNPGPDPKIHQEPHTAFSFFRDLRFHFCHLYITSHYLAQAIIAIVGPENMILPSSVGSKNNRQIAKIATEIAMLPTSFLRFEVTNLANPSVTITPSNEKFELEIEFPGPPLPDVEFGTKAIAATEFVGDGISKTFRLPFAPLESDQE